MGWGEGCEGKSACCPHIRNCIPMQHAGATLAVAGMACDARTMCGRDRGFLHLLAATLALGSVRDAVSKE